MRGIDVAVLTRAEREAVHWRLFAGEMADSATADVDGIAKDIDDERLKLSNASEAQLKTRARTRLGEREAALGRMRKGRASARELLWPPDEPEELDRG